MALIRQKIQNIGSGDLSCTASRPHNTSQPVSIDFENSQFAHLLLTRAFQPLHWSTFLTLRAMRRLRNRWKPLKPQKLSQDSNQPRSKIWLLCSCLQSKKISPISPHWSWPVMKFTWPDLTFLKNVWLTSCDADRSAGGSRTDWIAKLFRALRG